MKKLEKKRMPNIAILKKHIDSNIKQYIIVLLLFFLGIIIGTIITNYLQENEKNNSSNVQMEEHINNNEIQNAINQTIEKLKQNVKIDKVSMLREIIKNHIIFTFFMWFMGCSVIGIPFVYMMIIYKGMSLGYTISIIILTLRNVERRNFFIISNVTSKPN